MNNSLRTKALGLLVGVLSTITTVAQRQAPELMSKDPIKYSLMHSDFGAAGLNFPGKKFIGFVEGEMRGFLTNSIMGVRRNFKNASLTAGYAKDWPDENTYGFVSGGYSPRIFNPGAASNKGRDIRGIYLDSRVTLDRFLGKNNVSNNNIAVDYYGGVKIFPKNNCNWSISSGVGGNNYGVANISAGIIKTKPFKENIFHKNTLKPGLYFKAGGSAALNRVSRSSVNLGVGANF